jgi:siroheme synthase-like protein
MTSMTENDKTISDTGNNLFPIFVKLEELKLLIVGGGNVGLEKLQTVLLNSPSTSITLVAPEIDPAIRALAANNANIRLFARPYDETDLESKDIAIVAVDDRSVSETIARQARARGILVNVADTPDLCDFYLGSVVRRGNLKIAISTNGKSPTIAKRLKEEIGNMIPDEMDAVLDNMQTIRTHLNGDFAEKVRRLNELTSVLATPASAAEALAQAAPPAPPPPTPRAPPTRPPPHPRRPHHRPDRQTGKTDPAPRSRSTQMAADRQILPLRLRIHDHRPCDSFARPAWRIRRFPSRDPRRV